MASQCWAHFAASELRFDAKEIYRAIKILFIEIFRSESQKVDNIERKQSS